MNRQEARMDPADAPAMDATASVLAHRTLSNVVVLVSGLRTLAEIEPSLSPLALDIIDRCVNHGETAVESLLGLITGDLDSAVAR